MAKISYTRGDPITSLDDLMDCEVIIFSPCPKIQKRVPFGFFQNWQIRLCRNYIQAKKLYKAIKQG